MKPQERELVMFVWLRGYARFKTTRADNFRAVAEITEDPYAHIVKSDLEWLLKRADIQMEGLFARDLNRHEYPEEILMSTGNNNESTQEVK